MEAYTRRENVRIFNVKEEVDENTEVVERNLLEMKMQISLEKVKNIRFERVHRIPRKTQNQRPPNRPRPVIARFSHYQDKDFWILSQEWWYQKTNKTITLSTSHILYGWHDRTKHWQDLNYCLLITNYCIFCTSLRGDVLDFKNFLLFFPGKLEILKEIATAKKALLQFYRTWAFLLYSGTPLIRPPTGHENLVVLTGW